MQEVNSNDKNKLWSMTKMWRLSSPEWFLVGGLFVHNIWNYSDEFSLQWKFCRKNQSSFILKGFIFRILYKMFQIVVYYIYILFDVLSSDCRQVWVG